MMPLSIFSTVAILCPALVFALPQYQSDKALPRSQLNPRNYDNPFQREIELIGAKYGARPRGCSTQNEPSGRGQSSRGPRRSKRSVKAREYTEGDDNGEGIRISTH